MHYRVEHDHREELCETVRNHVFDHTERRDQG